MIRPGALGDFVLTLPVFAYLRRKFPEYHIEVMGYTHITDIAEGRYYVNKSFRFDHPEAAYLFLKAIPIPEGLTRYLSSFDIIISFLKNDIFVDNLRRTSAAMVLSHDPFPKGNEPIHIVDHLLLPWPDVTSQERVPKLLLTESDQQWASDFMDKHSINPEAPLVALHPGSGSHKKCWPVENFVSLAIGLRKELEAQFLLVSGPADEESTGYFLKHVSPLPLTLYNLTLPKLAAILERCSLFIGNDSGVTHLAAATGVNTIALFGPTDPKIWGPRGKRVIILQGELDCLPCTQEEKINCTRPSCMEVIHPEQVIATVKKVWELPL